jgi:hypothetical protein
MNSKPSSSVKYSERVDELCFRTGGKGAWGDGNWVSQVLQNNLTLCASMKSNKKIFKLRWKKYFMYTVTSII